MLLGEVPPSTEGTEKVKAFSCTFYLLMPPEKETSLADFVGGKVRSKFNVKSYQIAFIQTKAPTFPLCWTFAPLKYRNRKSQFGLNRSVVVPLLWRLIQTPCRILLLLLPRPPSLYPSRNNCVGGGGMEVHSNSTPDYYCSIILLRDTLNENKPGAACPLTFTTATLTHPLHTTSMCWDRHPPTHTEESFHVVWMYAWRVSHQQEHPLWTSYIYGKEQTPLCESILQNVPLSPFLPSSLPHYLFILEYRDIISSLYFFCDCGLPTLARVALILI